MITMDSKEITFADFTGLQSLSDFHNKGGKLFDGMQLFRERNYRTPLAECILKSWQIGSVKMDITGMGKYSESSCQIQIGDKIQSYPFSMLYVKTNF